MDSDFGNDYGHMNENQKPPSEDDVLRILNELKEIRAENVEWQKNHDAEAKEFRKQLEDRLKPLEDFVTEMKWSWKLILGFTGFFATLLTVGIKTWEFLKDHWK